MPRPLPPPVWLRTFEAAARHMSFTQAAEELHVTQSAVSQQIRLLEDRLAEPLFHRLPRNIQLTEAGKAYLPVVRDAFEQLSLGTEQVFGYSRTELVTIRATPGFGEFWLAPRLGDLYASHPEIEVRVTSTIWNAEFMETGVDLEVRYGTDEWPELETRRLTREYLVPVCAPSLAKHLDNDPHRLGDVRLLHVDGFRNGWAEWLHHAGVAGDVDAGHGSHFDTAILPIRLACEGLGIALGRWSLVERHIRDGRLVTPFDVTMPVDEAFYVAWPGEQPLRPEATVLRDWLLRIAERPVESL